MATLSIRMNDEADFEKFCKNVERFSESSYNRQEVPVESKHSLIKNIERKFR